MNTPQTNRLHRALPALHDAAIALAETTNRQVLGGYANLSTVATAAAGLGDRLRREGRLPLAAAVTLVAAVARQQVAAAHARGWQKTDAQGEPLWDPNEWADLDPKEAAGLLGDEVHSIALELLSSKDLVPESWVAGLCRTVSGLVAAMAQLMESLEDSATENADTCASLRISTHTSPFVRTERT